MAPVVIESNLVSSSPFRNGDYRTPPALPSTTNVAAAAAASAAAVAGAVAAKNGVVVCVNNIATNNTNGTSGNTNGHTTINGHQILAVESCSVSTSSSSSSSSSTSPSASNGTTSKIGHLLAALQNNHVFNTKASPTPSIASSNGGGGNIIGSVHNNGFINNNSKLTPIRNGHQHQLHQHQPDSNTNTNLSSQQFIWRVGLVNRDLNNHYLTAEAFGNKVNVSGTSLRKKQVWTVVPVPGGPPHAAYLMSHLHHYISVDEYGDVSCNATEPGEREKFLIEETARTSGGGDNEPQPKWLFYHERLQQYLTGHSDRLTCKAKSPTASEEWSVHLAVHPQVSLKSVGRKRYARQCGSEIVFDQDIPWTEASLMTFEFDQQPTSSGSVGGGGGRYFIKSCDGQFLHPDGKLLARATRDCLYTLCYYSSQLALRDTRGRYLTPFGSNGILMARNTAISKAELFVLEDNRAQAYLRAKNGRFVSTKQGMEVSANQDEVTEHETFQLEYDTERNMWRLRTYENNFWSLVNNGAIRASDKEENENSLFDLVWLDNGQVMLRSFVNCKYVAAKPTGQLTALADSVDSAEHFSFFLCNRPLLVLKCAFGYVGFKSGAELLECNKSTYDALWLEFNQAGEAYLKDMRGKYLAVGEDNMICTEGTKPTPSNRFQIQMSRQSKMLIRAPNGKYIVGEQNGLFRAIGNERDDATLWEF